MVLKLQSMYSPCTESIQQEHWVLIYYQSIANAAKLIWNANVVKCKIMTVEKQAKKKKTVIFKRFMEIIHQYIFEIKN